MTTYMDIIKEICKEEDIEFKSYSKDWVFSLKKDNKYKYITGYKFDLNKLASSKIVDDKYALYEVLNDKNIPIIEHNILFNKTNNLDYAKDSNKYQIAYDLFNKYKHIVIKANNGTCGTEVFNITSKDQIDIILDKLFINNHSVSICPFYDIENEYRAIILNGKIKIIYKKIKPVVIGNGIKTIRELLYEFNFNYFKDKLDDIKYDIILPDRKLYEYSWQFNLSRGAKVGIASNEIKNQIEDIALKCMDILDLKFCSVDIIKCKNNKIYVMEINSGVMMKNLVDLIDDGNNIVKDIYKEAIISMFK